MKNSLYLIAFLIPFFGCSTVPKTYHLWAGGRGDVYSETESTPIDQALATTLGGTVTTTSGDPSKVSTTGYGGQIGFTEQIESMVTTLSIFYVKYSPITYRFNSSKYGTIQESMSTSGIGLDGTIGWNLSIFRPGIGYKYESQSLDVRVSGSSLTTPVNTSTSTTLFMLGPSLAIDIPIQPSFHIVAQADYRFPLSQSSSVSSANSILAQLGIRVGGWEVK